MAEIVELKNTDRNQTFQATYYPEQIARRTKQKLYSVIKARSETGKLISIKQPFSFEILPGRSTSVHAVALYLPQVWQALKAGWLKEIKVEKSKVVAEGPEPKPAAVELASAANDKPKTSRSSKHGG